MKEAPRAPKLLKRRPRIDEDDIEPAVARIGRRREHQTIAVFSPVGECDEKSLAIEALVVERDLVPPRAIAPDNVQAASDVAQDPAFFAEIERHADRCVEADAGDIQKMAIGEIADVDRARGRCQRVCERRRLRARPSPEPDGMMPSAVGVPINGPATSLTVPSPPHANTASQPRFTKSCASSDA